MATAPASVGEAVASFADREHFRKAVRALLAAGFIAGDLSVLASHQPISEDETRTELVGAGLGDEIKYVGPLLFAGIALISGGPVAAAIGAVVGAGLGAAALKEFFDDYTAAPHAAEFEAALRAGAALLWVRCADAEREARALHILEAAGGRHAHIHSRPSEIGAD